MGVSNVSLETSEDVRQCIFCPGQAKPSWKGAHIFRLQICILSRVLQVIDTSLANSHAHGVSAPKEHAPSAHRALFSRPPLFSPILCVLSVVASALRKLGRNDDASTAILRAAAASPNDARVQYKLGQHLRSIGDLDAAVRAYARALELEPGHALATFWLSATRRIVSEGDVTA